MCYTGTYYYIVYTAMGGLAGTSSVYEKLFRLLKAPGKKETISIIQNGYV